MYCVTPKDHRAKSMTPKAIDHPITTTQATDHPTAITPQATGHWIIKIQQVAYQFATSTLTSQSIFSHWHFTKYRLDSPLWNTP